MPPTYCTEEGRQWYKSSQFYHTHGVYVAVLCDVCRGFHDDESDPYMPPDGYTYLVLVVLAVVAQALGWWVISWVTAETSGIPERDGAATSADAGDGLGALFFAERLSCSDFWRSYHAGCHIFRFARRLRLKERNRSDRFRSIYYKVLRVKNVNLQGLFLNISQ